MKNIIFSIALVLAGAAHAQDVARPLTAELASQLALYAMMASNAYVDDSEKMYFPLEKLGWKKVNEKGTVVSSTENSYRPRTMLGGFFSNLQFDIWEDENSNQTVFAFKGTQEKLDWITGNLMLGVSIPYKSAKKHVEAYVNAHPDRRVVLTGHSLGGGLALSASVWQGLDAYVFNTSPRIFDGLQNSSRNATRLSVFQEGEILEKIRSWYPKFLKTIKPDQIVETKFNYSGKNSHRSDLMAEGLLACSDDPKLKDFSSKQNLTVACYLKR